MPNLLCLDTYIVTDVEKFDDIDTDTKFSPESDFMHIQLPDFVENLTAEKHIDVLDAELYHLRRQFERCSPIIRLQSA